MSRRNNDAEAALGCLLIVVMPFVWLFSWMWEKSKTPLAVQIRQLDRPYNWGIHIHQQICPQCQAKNESGRHQCFQCGSSLTPADSQKAIPANQSSGLSEGVRAFLIIAFVAIVLSLLISLSKGGF